MPSYEEPKVKQAAGQNGDQFKGKKSFIAIEKLQNDRVHRPSLYGVYAHGDEYRSVVI